MAGALVLPARLAAVAVLRRRLTVGLLLAMPLAMYVATHDAVGRSVRSLAFGLSWAVSTLSFFAATAARSLEPRLVLAGWRRGLLVAGRLLGLHAIGAALTVTFSVLVAIDQPVRNIGGVVLDFAVTASVAVAVGHAIGSWVEREMEGTLVLFLLAGLQAVVNPFDSAARLLPFWSSRELGTYAVDGAHAGSLRDGLAHAGTVWLLCAVTVAAAMLRRQRSGRTPRRLTSHPGPRRSDRERR